VLERHAWTEAATLQVHATGTPSADALTHFARALGLARTRKPAAAQRELERLTQLRDQLTQSNDRYWAGQVEIQRLTAAAWTAWAAGQRDEALRLLRTAADQEDATEKAGTTPGPLMPARELLGDMLFELNQPAKALSEYEATLKKEPNRFWSVDGAARAAQLAGDAAKASRMYAQLLKVCRRADQPGRPELAEARKAAADVPDRR
jgi:tetratricopeptide (TPR) repeat protein